MTRVVYPHPGHITRRLHISLMPDADDPHLIRTALPLTPALFLEGRFRLAAVGIMVDLAAGSLGVQAVAPDWTATFDQSIHRLGEPEPGTTAEGVTRLVRAGKNTVVSETQVTVGAMPILYGETTFQRLPRRDDNPGGRALSTVRHLGKGEQPLEGPLAEVIGFRKVREGSVELDLSDLVRNSFGTIQGGVTGVAMEQAALDLAGPGSALEFLHIYFLSAAKVGPYRASASALARTGTRMTGRVELCDVGNDRLVAQGSCVTDRPDQKQLDDVGPA